MPGCAAAAARASASPSVESWSVTASTVTPCFAARATRARGASVPSEAVVCEWRSTAPRLLAVREVRQQRANAHAGGALRAERRVLVDERRARDVEVRPRNAAGELLDQEPGGGRAAVAAARVVEVGDVALELDRKSTRLNSSHRT